VFLRGRKRFGLVLLVGAIVSLASGQSRQSWQSAYDNGTEALERGEPREAAQLFESALALRPDDERILYGVVLSDLMAGKAAAALQSADHLLRLIRNKDGEFRLAMAVANSLAQHNQFAKSAEFVKVAQQTAPAVINGRTSSLFFEQILAALSSRMKRDQDAIQHLEHLMKSEPENAQHYYQLGLLLIRSGRFPESYELLRGASGRFPESFDVRLGYALSCYFTGRNDEAEAAYRQILGMRSQSAEPYFALGNFYADTGHNEDAAAAFGRAVELDPQDYLNQYMYGVELYRISKLAEAATHIRRAAQLNPAHADSHYWLGRIHLVQGQPTLARNEFETAVRLEPKHIGAYYQLALLYKREGDADKARHALEMRAELTRQLRDGIVAERMSPPELSQ
jgi:tetratricopeptide (TPR) repeat protein